MSIHERIMGIQYETVCTYKRTWLQTIAVYTQHMRGLWAFSVQCHLVPVWYQK